MLQNRGRLLNLSRRLLSYNVDYVLCYKENNDSEQAGAKGFRRVEIVQYRMQYHVRLQEATIDNSLI